MGRGLVLPEDSMGSRYLRDRKYFETTHNQKDFISAKNKKEKMKQHVFSKNNLIERGETAHTRNNCINMLLVSCIL